MNALAVIFIVAAVTFFLFMVWEHFWGPPPAQPDVVSTIEVETDVRPISRAKARDPLANLPENFPLEPENATPEEKMTRRAIFILVLFLYKN